MSVYTQLQTQDFERILSQYNLGKLITFEGIAAGIENTNYKLTLQKDGQTQFYFLTIFEQLKKSELEFFMPLLSHLQDNDCQLASPIKSIHGDLTFTIKKKDAAIFYCLPGKTLSTPNVNQCRLIGAQLAKVHKAAQTFTQSHDNNRGFYWLQRQVHCKQLKLTQANQQIMETELVHLQACWQQWGEDNALPKGFIHADLFPDNSLFVGDTLSGIIDFYAGGSDYWIYDVAICIMAWCQSDKQTIDGSLKSALLEGYQSQRQLSQSEIKSLPDFLRLAVLRFWISRVLVQNQQQQASLTTFKDPNEMKALLLNLKAP
jgi:homoserine kinase type II